MFMTFICIKLHFSCSILMYCWRIQKISHTGVLWWSVSENERVGAGALCCGLIHSLKRIYLWVLLKFSEMRYKNTSRTPEKALQWSLLHGRVSTDVSVAAHSTILEWQVWTGHLFQDYQWGCRPRKLVQITKIARQSSFQLDLLGGRWGMTGLLLWKKKWTCLL